MGEAGGGGGSRGVNTPPNLQIRYYACFTKKGQTTAWGHRAHSSMEGERAPGKLLEVTLAKLLEVTLAEEWAL